MPTYFVEPDAARAAGLLEQPTLRLSGPEAGRRFLADAAGDVVGFVDLARHWWTRTMWVHEAFEEPVVFRLRRLWTLRPRWRVFDAEGEEVGTVGGTCVRDRWDRVVFRRGDAGRSFLLEGGETVAEWAAEGDGGRLTLHPVVRDDPFWKMLVLAAVLVG